MKTRSGLVSPKCCKIKLSAERPLGINTAQALEKVSSKNSSIVATDGAEVVINSAGEKFGLGQISGCVLIEVIRKHAYNLIVKIWSVAISVIKPRLKRAIFSAFASRVSLTSPILKTLQPFLLASRIAE